MKIGKAKEYTSSLVGIAFKYICEPVKWNDMMTKRSVMSQAAQSKFWGERRLSSVVSEKGLLCSLG